MAVCEKRVGNGFVFPNNNIKGGRLVLAFKIMWTGQKVM